MITKEKNKFRLDIKVKIDGKWKHINKIFDLKREAQDYEDFIKEQAKTLEKQNNEFTLAKIIDEYLERKKLRLKQRPYLTIETIIRLYINPFFNLEGKPKDEFTLDKIIEFKRNIIEMDHIEAERKNRIFTQLKGIIERAVIRDALNSSIKSKLNDELEPIKNNKYTRDIDFWTIDEFKKFISTFDKTDWYYAAFNVLFFTGLRRSEFFGLTWSDFNEEIKSLYIHQQYDPSTKVYENSTKTANGTAYVQLDDNTFNLLVEFKKHTYRGMPNQRIFEKTVNPIVQMIKKHSAMANIKSITIHDIRRSHCSMLIQAYIDNNMSVDFLAIAKRMRHSVQETMEVYAMMYPQAKANLMGLVSNLSNQIRI